MGGIASDPELQDIVLLPQGFTEYIYHVGNVSEVHSRIGSGLTPGGKSLEPGKQSVFVLKANPMEDESGVEETSCDLTKPRIVPYQNTLKTHHDTENWSNLKLAPEKGLLFYHTRLHAIVLCDTLPASLHRESGFCMKTKVEFFQKVRLTPRVPRVVLRSNSQSWSTRSTSTVRKNIL